MRVLEARRVRHLIYSCGRGEEIPAALLRALDQAEVRSGWIEGVGSLASAEVALFDQATRSYGRARRVDGPCEVVSLAGSVARMDGSTFVRLVATLARETDLGVQVFAGELVWAQSYALELHVTAFDDAALARSMDEATGLALLQEGPAVAIESAQPRGASPFEPPRAPAPTAYGSHTSQAQLSTDSPAGPALPTRPSKPRDEVETYPETGDLVTHFHFGECSVLSSDGDRIRLRQERDGRVREVSLTMLKIEPPTIDEAGRRHFMLARKH